LPFIIPDSKNFKAANVDFGDRSAPIPLFWKKIEYLIIKSSDSWDGWQEKLRNLSNFETRNLSHFLYIIIAFLPAFVRTYGIISFFLNRVHTLRFEDHILNPQIR